VSTRSAGRRKAQRSRQAAFCVVLIAVISLAACVTEKSSDPRLGSVMHQCFRTTGNAVLFKPTSAHRSVRAIHRRALHSSRDRRYVNET
jgi:hypothetical protein